MYGPTTPGIKYVHKKHEWLGYGDYAVVSVSGEKLPAAINKWVRACGRQSSPRAQDFMATYLTTHLLQRSEIIQSLWHPTTQSNLIFEAVKVVVTNDCIML